MLKILAFVFLGLTAALLIIPHMLTVREPKPLEQGFRFMDSTQAYRELGEGEPIILVHGAVYSDPWRGFEEILAEHRKVYVLDLPGFGASQIVSGHLHTTDLFAESLCRFIQFEDLQDADVAGYSLGALVAAKSAASECFSGTLHLVGLPGEVEGELYDLQDQIPLFLQRYLIGTGWAKERFVLPVAYTLYADAARDDPSELLQEIKSTDPKSVVDVDYRNAAEQDLRAIWPRITNEVQVIYGEEDVLKSSTNDLVENPVLIGGVGHNPWGAAEEMVEILK